MSFESPYAAYDHLSKSIKDAMIDVIKSIIDNKGLKEINSSTFGNKILKLDSSNDFKQHCGTHSRQCIGLLLKEYLAEQPKWSGPVIKEFNGREQKIYSRDPD